MSSERKKVVNGFEIKEYYWGRKMVVYIDNKATEETFEEVCERLSNIDN